MIYLPPKTGGSSVISSPYLSFFRLLVLIFSLCLLLYPPLTHAQFHEAPSCKPNTITGLAWADGVQEFVKMPDGSLIYTTFIEGYTLSYTISGNTKSLTDASPLILSNLTNIDALNLYTNGIGKNPIYITIDISPPIEGDIGMTLFGINQTGVKRMGGDQVSISANFEGGASIYPQFTTPSISDYTADEASGILDAHSSNFSNNQMVGINWYDSTINQIKITWKDCSTCDKEFHSISIGNLDFCTFVNAGTFDKPVNKIFTNTENIHVFHYDDHNNSESHLQTYALTDLFGNILTINNTPIFPKQAIGMYQIYAINFKKEGVFSNYTVGENIATLEGPYYHIVEQAFEVIPFNPNQVEDEVDLNLDMITVQQK